MKPWVTCSYIIIMGISPDRRLETLLYSRLEVLEDRGVGYSEGAPHSLPHSSLGCRAPGMVNGEMTLGTSGPHLCLYPRGISAYHAHGAGLPWKPE